MEPDFVPYQATQAFAAQRALVLAPHADDETLGCGGAIAAHVAQGVPVGVIVLTDGASYGDPVIRQQECRKACDVLGCGEPQFWGLPDRQLAATTALVDRLSRDIRDTGADLLYAPSPWEIHPDHRQAAWLAIRSAQATGCRIAFYEVGAPLRPNALLDITAHADKKAQAAACYPSQQAQQDYAGQLAALNRYRTYTLPAEVSAAEAYLLVGPAELAQELPRWLAANPVASVAAPAETEARLVSVLVRSIERDTLGAALDSIAVQTYPAIEVVVVSANPEHGPLPDRCGPYPLRLITPDEPLRRSQTANLALESARGSMLLFLDDDDWLLPSHVARLARVLDAQPQVLAAYSGIYFADMQGRPLGQTMDMPFDGMRQLAGNLTPIHSVLFRRDLVERGCRFDESMDHYEDWDFWLQASRHTFFAHVPGVSAAYRIHDNSGVHAHASPAAAASEVIWGKWHATWRADQVAALMARARTTEDFEQRVAAVEAELAQVRADSHATIHQQALTIERQRDNAEYQQRVLAARDEVVAVREQEIRELRASTSWRVTAPLRWLMGRLKPAR